MIRSVLVVDDDPEFRELAGRLLAASGLAVVGEAGSVAAALEAATRLEPAGVLVDVQLLNEAGFDVVAQAGDAQDLLRKGLAHRPAVVIADVNMPPGHQDDGLRAAIELRRQRPETGVLVLSQYYEEPYALDLIGERAEGVGYLLKERVGDVESFVDAVTRVAGGGSALDPEVVGRMLGRRHRDGPLDRLSPRERDVLAAMAEGKSNRGIAQTLLVSQAAVERHVTSIFHKLALDPAQTEHRRVLAVLAYLRDAPGG